MNDKIQAIRGMNDVLPDEIYKWQSLESVFSDCMRRYDYKEIRFPVLEGTQLFKRTIGEVTDIVEKEMYTFADLNGDSLTLRPEGTAGCVRACLEHGLLHNQQQKLWYIGPMFRHEKPQKGRYRQFYQFGVEALGVSGVSIELELIAICKRIWSELGFEDHIELQVNTIGEIEEREKYRKTLVSYFKKHFEHLDEDSKKRLERNPLRILDSKNPSMQSLIANAPKLIDEVGEKSRQHFSTLCSGLRALNIPYTINPTLVRGLDYYGHTVFEWITNKLGSQATVCAGGRYDKLVEHLGGKPTFAAGFAMGMERLLLLKEKLSLSFTEQSKPLIYFIGANHEAIQQALVLAESLRTSYKNLEIAVNTTGGSFKSQFKKADKSGAQLALILGSDELHTNTIAIKYLREKKEQMVIAQKELPHLIKSFL